MVKLRRITVLTLMFFIVIDFSFSDIDVVEDMILYHKSGGTLVLGSKKSTVFMEWKDYPHTKTEINKGKGLCRVDYKSFSFFYYSEEDKVYDIVIKTTDWKTSRNVKIGMQLDDVKRAYPELSFLKRDEYLIGYYSFMGGIGFTACDYNFVFKENRLIEIRMGYTPS